MFVVFIAYHAVLAAGRAVRAGRDGNWWKAAELGVIAVAATLLVIGAVAGALRDRSRTPRRPTL